MSGENVQVVERAIEAFNRGDLAQLIDSFTMDGEWHATPDFPLGQLHRGRAELEHLFREWWVAWQGVRLAVEEVAEAGDRVIVVGAFQGRASGSGTEVSVPRAWIFELQDGRVSRVLGFHDGGEARDALRELESAKPA